MGAAASIPAIVDLDIAKKLAGEKWNEETETKFREILSSGKESGISGDELKDYFPEFFPQMEAKEELAPIRTVQTNHFMCAVDGSDIAHFSFLAAKTFRENGIKSVVQILHVEGTKEYLPPQFHSAAIKTKYEADCTGNFPEDSWMYSGIDKGEDDTKSALVNFVNKANDETTKWSIYPKMLICGLTGRKNREGKSTIFGQVSGLAMRSVKCPVMIVKNQIDLQKPQLYLIPTDSSDRAKEAYEAIHTLVRPDKDEMVFLHISTSEDAEGTGESNDLKIVTDKYNEFISSSRINASFKSVSAIGGNISNTIVSWAYDNVATFICICVRKEGRLGSIGDNVIGDSNAKSNFIVVKTANCDNTVDHVL